MRWKFKTNDHIYSSAAVGVDGRIYVGSTDGCLYALGADGRRLWRRDLGAPIRSSPALAARLKTSGAHEAGQIVSAWLGAESANPWQAAAELAQRGLAQRGLLDVAEVVQFGFVKTPVFQRPAETAALAARGPVAAV